MGRIITGDDVDKFYKSAKPESDPSGTILMDGQAVADTKQCCHCGKHYISIKGSGKRRGFCTKCMNVTCGDPACDPCRPMLLQLEQYENEHKNK